MLRIFQQSFLRELYPPVKVVCGPNCPVGNNLNGIGPCPYRDGTGNECKLSKIIQYRLEQNLPSYLIIDRTSREEQNGDMYYLYEIVFRDVVSKIVREFIKNDKFKNS